MATSKKAVKNTTKVTTGTSYLKHRKPSPEKKERVNISRSPGKITASYRTPVNLTPEDWERLTQTAVTMITKNYPPCQAIAKPEINIVEVDQHGNKVISEGIREVPTVNDREQNGITEIMMILGNFAGHSKVKVLKTVIDHCADGLIIETEVAAKEMSYKTDVLEHFNQSVRNLK